MSKGSEEKEHKFDHQCDYCGKWYRKRGIDSHQHNCPENPDNQETEETDIMPSENPPEETEESDEGNNEVESEENIVCPSCGNVDNDTPPKVYYASDIVDNFSEDLSKQDIQMLNKKELFCNDCHNAFDV